MLDFQVGCLSQKANNWLNIGASDTVLSWVNHGVPLSFDTVPVPFEIQNRRLSHVQSAFVSSELDRLETSGVIERCLVKPQWCSPISCVPKKGGKHRLIIDLRFLNSHCSVPKFNNEDIRVVQQYIQYNDLLATVDLQDGFYHIVVKQEDRKYLGFQWLGQYFQ